MAAWTYQALAGAVAALPPETQQAGPQAVADALNAQTLTLTGQTFLWSKARLIARLSPTGDWSRIVARARLTPALPPATAADEAILAAINAVEADGTDIIDPTVTATWNAFEAGLSTLSLEGDLSPATVAAINALTTVVAPAWSPAVTAGDVQTAQAQP